MSISIHISFGVYNKDIFTFYQHRAFVHLLPKSNVQIGIEMLQTHLEMNDCQCFPPETSFEHALSKQ